MVKKTYLRGKTLEELLAMSLEEFAQLVDARARRFLKRLPVHYKKLLAKVQKIGKARAIRTHLREAVILPQWVEHKFAVHTGKEWKEITITPEMIGRRLGEFAPTTGRVVHSGPGIGATRSSKFLPLK